jgi:hypothetical protein
MGTDLTQTVNQQKFPIVTSGSVKNTSEEDLN